jgi:hypothetical protein
MRAALAKINCGGFATQDGGQTWILQQRHSTVPAP